jgi:SAM-dependent methyltransferase
MVQKLPVLSRLKSLLLHYPMMNATSSVQRTTLVAPTQGRVLELCFETDENLPYYSPWVTELALVCLDGAPAEPRETTTDRGLRVKRIFLGGEAEKLPFEDSRFDWAVSTMTLCRMKHPAALLPEIGRVLKPSGAYLFLEHGRSSDLSLRVFQERLDPWWSRVGGCELGCAIDDMIRDAGFRLDMLERYQLGRPKFISSMYRGSANRAST